MIFLECETNGLCYFFSAVIYCMVYQPMITLYLTSLLSSFFLKSLTKQSCASPAKQRDDRVLQL